jgi:thiol:disulfide interchange protein DsbD
MNGGNLLAHGWLFAYASVFISGFLTSLTPCVYPLIPITMSIFGARDEHVGRGRALALATSYVLGIAAMYTGLGVSAGLGGRAFGTFMANPLVIVPIAVLFLVMAASMFGAFDMNLPTSVQTRLTAVGGKGFGGAFAMGLVGGIIAAPCTGPVLASLLLYVATTRSVGLGGSLLFTYALGMGVLFFAIAAFAVALPRSGPWMERIKSFFGVVMLLAAAYFLRNVIPPLGHWGRPTLSFLGVSIVLVVAGLLMGAIHLSFHDTWPKRMLKALGITLVVIGGFSGIAWALTPKPLNWIHGEAAGMAAAKAAHKPAIIDFFADWCIPCKEMDTRTFSNEEVMRELARFQLVKMDCSKDDDPVVKQTQARYQADTLPTVVLVDSSGQVAKRIDRFVKPDELLPLLRAVQ